MNIGIIGGGSIGLLVSSYLANENTVTLYINRKAQQEKLELEQLNVLKASTFFKKIYVTPKLITELTTQDCIIVCVKQTDIPQVLSYINKINVKTPLIFLQNGMGHIEAIKKVQNPTYIGVVEHGAHRINDYTVNHLGDGIIKIASVTGGQQQLDYIVKSLHQTTFPFHQVDNWSDLLKKKLIINAVINPLTALFDVPNGAIITNKHIHLLAKEICKETATVLHLDTRKSWESVLETANNTSENVSSMRADVQNNRPTEIEAISGYVLRESKGNLPYTAFVYHAILAKKEP